MTLCVSLWVVLLQIKMRTKNLCTTAQTHEYCMCSMFFVFSRAFASSWWVFNARNCSNDFLRMPEPKMVNAFEIFIGLTLLKIGKTSSYIVVLLYQTTVLKRIYQHENRIIWNVNASGLVWANIINFSSYMNFTRYS